MSTDLPKYTRWDQVPDGLHTKTQLANMTPPRKLPRDVEPVARVLYHGNKYTGLYRLSDSAEKAPPSPAQLLAIAVAKAAQWICKRCDYQADRDGPPLGRGRLCDRCHDADSDYREHLRARRHAQEHVDKLGSRGVLVHATGMETLDGPPSRVVAIAIADETVVADLPVRIGPPGYRAVLDTLHQILTERGAWKPSEVPGYCERLVAGWSFDVSDRPCLRLLNPDVSRDLWAGREAYPWLGTWTMVQSLWGMYRREPQRPVNVLTPTDIVRSPALPGETGDAVEDALTAVRLLKAIAAGQAPIAEDALFRHPKHGPAITA